MPDEAELPPYSITEAWEPDVCYIEYDGHRSRFETHVTRITDWRTSPIGPINMGKVILGKRREIVEPI